jgi:glycosyltransferase involved in cell wall biosynthesis
MHNILIFGSFYFPYGSAGASRTRTLAKGLVEKNFNVHVVTTSQLSIHNVEVNSEKASFRNFESDNSGYFEYDGITYECLGGPNKKDHSRTQKIIRYLAALVISWKKIYLLLVSKKYDSVLFYGRSAFHFFPAVVIARINSINIFYDMVEWFPPRAFRLGLLNPFFWDDWLGRHLPLLGCKGVISITTFIADRYARYNISTFILPSIFDFSISDKLSPFHLERGNIEDGFIVSYAGSCKLDDGFDILLESIRICVLQSCPVFLRVIGTDGLSGTAKFYRKVCEQDETLKDRVLFLGRVNDKEYYDLLYLSDCLTLPRPNSQVTQAAFPTRLPEFLSTGRPVLTTNVPDISRYLIPEVHAEIVPANSAESLANGIVRLCKDRNRSEKMGLMGYQQALKVFNYKSYIDNLAVFLSC